LGFKDTRETGVEFQTAMGRQGPDEIDWGAGVARPGGISTKWERVHFKGIR
jgi:hypothetical protein